MNHLIRYSDPSRHDYRIKYISELQRKLDSSNGDKALTMNCCTTYKSYILYIHTRSTGIQ